MRKPLVVIGVVCAGLFALLVWPTPYRFDVMMVGDQSYVVRTNRLTGVPTFFDPRMFAATGAVAESPRVATTAPAFIPDSK